jgi:hypothetical protein
MWDFRGCLFRQIYANMLFLEYTSNLSSDLGTGVRKTYTLDMFLFTRYGELETVNSAKAQQRIKQLSTYPYATSEVNQTRHLRAIDIERHCMIIN